MAWVNVNTAALAETRFHNFCDDLKFTRHEGIGVLVLFWHDTQEKLISEGSKAALMQCIPLKNEMRETMFKALLDNSYITLETDGSYLIRGNKRHIDAILSKKNAGQKGGLQKAKNLRKTNRSKQTVADGRSAVPNSMQFNAIQFNAIQPNSIQTNSKQNKTIQQELLVCESGVKDAAPEPSVHPLFEIWNDHCGKLPHAKGMNATRQKLARSRWKENSDKSYWTGVVLRIARSPFCRGEIGKSQWVASFDWFLKPDTHYKVIEGKYDERGVNQESGEYESDVERHNRLILERMAKKRGVENEVRDVSPDNQDV
jgi:hypothetical protein